MPMGFVVLLPFSTSFSTPENAVMHPVSLLSSDLLPVAGGCEEGRQVKGGPSGIWSLCVWDGGGRSELGSEGGSNE